MEYRDEAKRAHCAKVNEDQSCCELGSLHRDLSTWESYCKIIEGVHLKHNSYSALTSCVDILILFQGNVYTENKLCS